MSDPSDKPLKRFIAEITRRSLVREPARSGALAIGRLWEGLQMLQTRWRYHRGRPYIVVHSMGRVGSISVTLALRERFPERHCFHTHYLHADTIRESREGFNRMYRVTGRPGLHRNHRSSQILRSRLDRGECGDWMVVSLVRDPVARNISAFFKNFDFNHPQLGRAFLADPKNTDHLVDLFKYPEEPEHSFALDWFDREVRDVVRGRRLLETLPARRKRTSRFV